MTNKDPKSLNSIHLWPAPGRGFLGDWDHYRLLKVSAINRKISDWNEWRVQNPKTILRLSGADLRGLNLTDANLSGGIFKHADLSRANLEGVILRNVDFRNAKFDMANLSRVQASDCDFRYTNLSGSHITDAIFTNCKFERCDLSHANLTNAELKGTSLKGIDMSSSVLINTDLSKTDLRSVNFDDAILHGTNLKGANLNQASVLRTSVRNVEIDEYTRQRNLKLEFYIWRSAPGFISFQQNKVHDIRIAYFNQLISERETITHLIEAGTLSAVLLLGRFSPKRKKVLDNLGLALQRQGYIPLIFDFPKPEERDLLETVKFLATISSFIVVDLTTPKSSPLELQLIVPDLMIPVIPIIQAKNKPFSMFWDLRSKYSWVLEPVSYQDSADLEAHLDKGIIHRANLEKKRINKIRKRSTEEVAPIANFS